MSQDVSVFGLSVRLVATKTFPVGITLTQFADDGDPIDSPSVQIADAGMGPNGDLVHWSKANPLPVTLNVIPDSDDDKNLNILFQANRPKRGSLPAGDKVTITVVYPNGSRATYSNGIITDGMPGLSAASAGRLKTRAYAFKFEGFSNS